MAENVFEFWTGFESEIDEVFACDERWRDERFGCKLFALGAEEVVVISEAVTAATIYTVQFHFFLKGGACHESFNFGGAHLLHVHEVHVVGHHGANRLRGCVRALQPMQDLFCHLGTYAVVAVESDAVVFRIVGIGGWFSDVVQKNGEGKFLGDFAVGPLQHFQHDTGVLVNIALGVPLRGLFTADEIVHFRHNVAHESALSEEFKSTGAGRGGEGAGEFVTDPLGADL